MAVEPLAGRRVIAVRKRGTKEDWALFLHEVIERYYPTAEKVILVMDNLNTYSPSSF
ncbi:hypothetical protein KDH_01740 [Dictyobacter sp. S3.2.2.5]|uniref:Tc1-like transposase DDE domain-containing protein n=1 Tax=Dictyobacter halimunensis TaxID=3026934 RepID=A0ABQ6FIC9_9CHLR|nr:hypothetical protein KDH_01740 [Dictyobacter sp. S3.2.2.5]